MLCDLNSKVVDDFGKTEEWYNQNQFNSRLKEACYSILQKSWELFGYSKPIGYETKYDSKI